VVTVVLPCVMQPPEETHLVLLASKNVSPNAFIQSALRNAVRPVFLVLKNANGDVGVITRTKFPHVHYLVDLLVFVFLVTQDVQKRSHVVINVHLCVVKNVPTKDIAGEKKRVVTHANSSHSESVLQRTY